ncbi:MAG TPA: 16S rRNA (cytosine(1402)-N(4))-methyltransferase RsmH [Ignavibacteria bacterium]|nr:16S rRNA (cytosine(1402)-N(4))-methyltransferase RsmH [Ignavibacteria bacterium]HMR39462.1 16S rRNA (cytosine(1402)-N(4))-methyltransferase RsmH [Ignavibacteria bacterium]
MLSETFHIPVLSHEAIELLINTELKEQILVDGTLGGGGYTKLICEKLNGSGKVISIDKDLNALEYSKDRLKDLKCNIEFVNGNFGELGSIIRETGIGRLTGIVLDLGLSSYQLEAEEGFSFMKDTDLDMRAFKKEDLTASEVLNSYTKEELMNIFEKYGEIGNAERLVKAILLKRRNIKFRTTFDLNEVVNSGYSLNRKNQIDFLARIYQALRIEVNNELKNLENVLRDSVELVIKGGRIVIISYHSLEDRIVKNFFRDSASKHIKSDSPYGDEEKIPELKIITKKALVPSHTEIKSNSRSRSAKLRAAEII